MASASDQRCAHLKAILPLARYGCTMMRPNLWNKSRSTKSRRQQVFQLAPQLSLDSRDLLFTASRESWRSPQALSLDTGALYKKKEPSRRTARVWQTHFLRGRRRIRRCRPLSTRSRTRSGRVVRIRLTFSCMVFPRRVRRAQTSDSGTRTLLRSAPHAGPCNLHES
jgi:hypothetical protein